MRMAIYSDGARRMVMVGHISKSNYHPEKHTTFSSARPKQLNIITVIPEPLLATYRELASIQKF